METTLLIIGTIFLAAIIIFKKRRATMNEVEKLQKSLDIQYEITEKTS
jgi:hypothetical protein